MLNILVIIIPVNTVETFLLFTGFCSEKCYIFAAKSCYGETYKTGIWRLDCWTKIIIFNSPINMKHSYCSIYIEFTKGCLKGRRSIPPSNMGPTVNATVTG